MTAPAPGRPARSHMALGLILGAVVLAADQASKFWILNVLDLRALGRVDLIPTLSFTMVWNRGVTFGLLTGSGGLSRFILAGIALLVVGALFLWLRRAESALTAAAIGAIAGGAIGNVIDRLRFGAVVDFIHFHVGTWSWYVFNVADAAIVCGVAVLVLDGLRPHRRTTTGEPPDRLMRPGSGATEGP
ncbi:signal peptidase II [Acidisphaera rubrifaciens]|uniref:Lipoprotein signal peptidase n=1 Tax=Acidisphaera rubrifaciens HS-AP3 TaxID=1231350 RepID=A0A0D6PAI5_9PROT|nr:signal peptidase II [Acidisphaera rubrifaciens]GAN77884.1 lipoprotein signal peptidase [Acidisphaera rubrifaciens HS-AP3]